MDSLPRAHALDGQELVDVNRHWHVARDWPHRYGRRDRRVAPVANQQPKVNLSADK